MKETLKRYIDLMVENNDLAKPYFKWESYLSKHICAMLVAIEEKQFNGERIKEIKQYIKAQVSVFSSFRESTSMPLVTLLSMEDNYKECFGEVKVCYDTLKEKGYKRSAYLPLVAYELAAVAPKVERNQVIERSHMFYRGMKEKHFWLTSPDDYAMALVLGTTTLDVEETIIHVEECYEALEQKGFRRNNALQTLSHIMMLSDEPVQVKCNRVGAYHDRMKQLKCRLSNEALPLIGILSLLTPQVEQVVDEIKEAETYLKTHKAYSGLKMTRQQRVMLCVALLCQVYMKSEKEQILRLTMGNLLTALILAQQIIVVGAASVAVVSATS